MAATLTYRNQSSSDQIVQIPTLAAIAPQVRSVGAVGAAATAFTPGVPAGAITNDILLLFIETENQVVSVSGGNQTWQQVTGSPVIGTATRLTVFWARVGTVPVVAPQVSDSGDHQIARMIAVSGCPTSGNPWDVVATSVEASDTSGAIPAGTTGAPNELVIAAIATALPDSNATTVFSAWANIDLSNLLEYIDNSTNAGSGGAIGVAAGLKIDAGPFVATAVTCSSSTAKAMMSIALKGSVTLGAPFADLIIPSDSLLSFELPTVGGGYLKQLLDATPSIYLATVSPGGTGD